MVLSSDSRDMETLKIGFIRRLEQFLLPSLRSRNTFSVEAYNCASETPPLSNRNQRYCADSAHSLFDVLGLSDNAKNRGFALQVGLLLWNNKKMRGECALDLQLLYWILFMMQTVQFRLKNHMFHCFDTWITLGEWLNGIGRRCACAQVIVVGCTRRAIDVHRGYISGIPIARQEIVPTWGRCGQKWQKKLPPVAGAIFHILHKQRRAAIKDSVLPASLAPACVECYRHTWESKL